VSTKSLLNPIFIIYKCRYKKTGSLWEPDFVYDTYGYVNSMEEAINICASSDPPEDTPEGYKVDWEEYGNTIPKKYHYKAVEAFKDVDRNV
jgi:hypothetical protein